MTQTGTLTLTDFLLARIAEGEEMARKVASYLDDGAEVQVYLSRHHGNEVRGEYVVPYDPARVLAECEAKRRIVGLHFDPTYEYLPDYDPACTGSYDTSEARSAHCDTLRVLALPYADHPDYREEWRP